MDGYGFLNIPKNSSIGKTIYKNIFYEKADLSASDKKLLMKTVDKITWIYCLQPETMNIPAYKDEERDYSEIEIIEVKVHQDHKLERIAEIAMRAIPYPMLLIFKMEEKRQFYVAHQRTNQSDSSKNIIEGLIATDWLDSDSDLFEKLDIRQMRFANFFMLYTDIVDVISIYNVSDIILDETSLTGAEARELSAQIAEVDEKISILRTKLKKENQFNRKMELHIKINELKEEKENCLEEINFEGNNVRR